MEIAVLLRVGRDERRDGWVYLLRKQNPVPIPVTRVAVWKDLKVKPRELDRIKGITQARRAINRNDVFSALEATRSIARIAAPDPQPTILQKALAHLDIPFLVASEQNKYLNSARLVIWAHDDPARVREVDLGGGHTITKRVSLDLGVLCKDLKTALFVREALGELRICLCCASPFEPDRPDQYYCSLRCRETFRKRRLRAKAKAKQGGK